ncbi:MAG TPA: HIT domain-containing protein [Ramlibacter sp.]|nr:HIT domain-containing protein [Ramlibacter sp.]
MREPGCPLCDAAGEHIVFAGDKFRLVRADEKGYPAFYRVIWNGHVREFSDLEPGDRAACIDAVVDVERVLRAELQPAKVNLATLGNMVPHLHWHVIARFESDPAWPAPVWAAAQREPDAALIQSVGSLRPELEDALRAALSARRGNCARP